MNVFKKFGFTLTTTCSLAMLFSLVYFIALSHGFGPEGQSGSCTRIIRRLGVFCRKGGSRDKKKGTADKPELA